jgi:hypothetical protein
MEIYKYSPDFEATWDRVVNNSKNGNFLHLRSYMEYHNDRFDDQSILVMSGGKAVAILPCNRTDKLIVSHGGLTYGGLLYGNDLHAPDVLQIFPQIRQYFQSIGCNKLIYKAVPHVFHKYPAEEDLYALCRADAKLIRRDISSVIGIGNRPKFSDSRKNTARKAEKAGASFVELNNVTEFHELLSSVLAKFGSTPVHSAPELMFLKERFPDHIRLFGALLHGKLVAAALIYDFGHIVHSQYLASSDEGKLLGALDYVLSQLIQTTFAEKKYFSFGISSEQQGRYLNEGLIRQKEGFGGRGVVHDFYEWIF